MIRKLKPNPPAQERMGCKGVSKIPNPALSLKLAGNDPTMGIVIEKIAKKRCECKEYHCCCNKYRSELSKGRTESFLYVRCS